MGARLTVEIDGEQVPYDQASWVIFDHKNFPKGFMTVERSDLSNDTARAYTGARTAVPYRAFRRWGTLSAWHEGDSIRLVNRAEMRVLTDQHMGKTPVGQQALPEDKGEQ